MNKKAMAHTERLIAPAFEDFMLAPKEKPSRVN